MTQSRNIVRFEEINFKKSITVPKVTILAPTTLGFFIQQV